MKNLFTMIVIAILATISCTEENPPVPVILPDVTITAPDRIYPNKTYALTATLSEPATKEVTIKLANENSWVIIFEAEEIKIAKGEIKGSVAFTTKNPGIVKIPFTSSDATVKTPEVTLNVPTVEPNQYDYVFFEKGCFSAISKIVIGNTTVKSSAANSPDGENKPLEGDDYFQTGGISDMISTRVPLTDGISYTIYYDNFTANDGTEMAVALYIDWDDDINFGDPEETIIIEKGIFANAKKEISGTISIPPDAKAASRVRLICYEVEENYINYGGGEARSGHLMDFIYTK